jgi:hypothetical protein
MVDPKEPKRFPVTKAKHIPQVHVAMTQAHAMPTADLPPQGMQKQSSVSPIGQRNRSAVSEHGLAPVRGVRNTLQNHAAANKQTASIFLNDAKRRRHKDSVRSRQTASPPFEHGP